MEKTTKPSQKEPGTVKIVSKIYSEKFAFVGDNLTKIQEFKESQIDQIQSIMIKRDDVDFGIGSMFGAFMGDSLGSYCEFKIQTMKYDDPEMDLIMEMPGKGTWNIKPAQFTDDSELASHLLEGLLNGYNPKQNFESQKNKILMKIAQQYVTWFKSEPFDIGNTTRKAFKLLKSNLYELKIQRQEKQEKGIPNQEIEKEENKILHKTFVEIEHENRNSQSNGSLMRITPMAFFISLLLQKKEYSELNVKHFEKFIKDQVSMTHGSKEILESSFVWVELLVDLILRKKKERTLQQIYHDFIENYKNNEFLKEWIEDSVSYQWMNAAQQQGWARVAFTYGIKALKTLSEIKQQELSQKNYQQLIKQVIRRVGDSDTNACIVGGVIGAVLGFKRLPVKYLTKQFQLELNEQDKQCSFRGHFYEPKRQFYKAFQLFQKFQTP